MSNIEETPKINQKIYSDNYLLNSYNHLIKKKEIHFLSIFIELSLNIFQEFEIFINGLKLNSVNNKFILLNINNILEKISNVNKLLIIISSIIIFDFLYIFIKKKKFNIKHIIIYIIINVLEIVWFRTFNIIIFSLFFKLKKEFFIVGLIFIIPHIYLIINNFINNHLYYFVPEFIDYPYDEFSSQFDILLFTIKLILACAASTTNSGFGKFCYLILFLLQIIISFYFIHRSINHSYLFMKNTFLNETRLSLYISNSFIILLSVLYGKTEIISTIFFIILICILIVVVMGYMYYIYSPFYYITIKRETPLENTFLYLYILSEKNDFNFIIKNKIKEHYQKCGFCELCKKYINIIRTKKNIDNC